ncbi:bifunctional DNA-formamidopyrimidine glycosylase/DNA-(apurinic or apyrimidinic site) lyase [Candidatus Roizmanbacteria bacterium]|nr:bifunctional DNA-formamidopyrimidine glycosylase/DNA-(apurinic or apyrimidinic site) lyase [Candidatus Roizmanbacteria bacterium]
MPELPEVETIKRNLKPNIISKTISEIEILSPKNFLGNKKEVIGSKIMSVDRYGKVLVFKLAKPAKSSNKKYLNIHFKLSGQMLFANKVNNAVFKNKIPFTKGNTLPANTTRIIIKFKDKSGLFFNDLRKFGWIKISNKPLIPKGIDVLSKEFTVKYLEEVLPSRRPIKVALMDQNKITGIGNIYANDSLFLAKIHPQRLANSLTKLEINKLYISIKKTILDGIEDQGSSGADEAFILPDGSKGQHQRNFLVYQREKQPCLVCKSLIKRIKHHGRSSFFCSSCQK